MKTILMALTFANSRIGRGFYWLAIIALMSLTLNFFVITIIIAYIPSQLVLLFVAVVVGVVSTYCQLVVCAARCRDIGRPGTRAFMTLIPFVGIFVVCWLGLVKSVPDAER